MLFALTTTSKTCAVAAHIFTKARTVAASLLLLALVGCSPLASIDSGSTRAEGRAAGVAELTVLYVAAEGFAYEDENGNLTGVTVEIMRDFAEWFERYHATNIVLNFVEEENWQRFYQRVVNANGGVFGLGNVTITEARKAELQFSPAYLDNVAVLITAADRAELTSWEQFSTTFAGLQPLAFAGTLHQERIEALAQRYQPNAQLALATSNPEIISKVAEEGYYSYIDAYNYWRAVDAGVAVRHHPLADEFGETFGIIMPHSNDWAPLLTAFFAAEGGYRDTPRYRQHLVQHLGEALAETLENARLQQR